MYDSKELYDSTELAEADPIVASSSWERADLLALGYGV